MRYYIADLHLEHEKVARLRGFDSVAEHDDTILLKLSRLQPTDQLWILGDICSGTNRSANAALSDLRRTVRAQMHLVTGNHDPAHPMPRSAHKWQPIFLEVFTSVQPFARHRIDGTSVLLSHFPYQGGGDHTDEDRLIQYRLPDLGEWLIHGHTHSYMARSGPRSICVSAEACGTAADDIVIPSEANIAAEIRSGRPWGLDQLRKVTYPPNPMFPQGGRS